jgi:uncharacterized protein (DUF58 family)
MNLHIIKSLYIGSRLYLASVLISLLFIAGYFADPFFLIAKLCLLLFVFTILTDFILLYFTGREIVLLTREMPEKFSNGDENKVIIAIKNNHFFPFTASIIDEIPVQFQIRDYKIIVYLKPSEEKQFEYILRPVNRGEYKFGKTNVYIATTIGMLNRRFLFNENPAMVRVFPSFLNIHKFEFLAISNRLTEAGIKRLRKIGHQLEFDQIRDYVRGDDTRTINWKATAKRGKLMTNQYQDERSQQIYNLIDMGRIMKMPFEGMSLLDYAINSSLILANTALIKHDKAGLITFNTSVNTFYPAENRNNTTMKMMEVLYNQNTLFAESNYDLLYITIKRMIHHRSLLVLYTNFESLTSVNRQLAFFQRLAKSHLLLVVIFENTEILEFSKRNARSLEEIYTQTIAEKFMHDKNLIVRELNNHGVMSVLTKPQDLSVKLVNKYLELKDRNLI